MRRLLAPMFLSALAAVVLGVSLQLSSGAFHRLAIALAVLSAALAVAVVLLPLRKEQALPAGTVLGAGFLLGVYCHLFASPTPDADPLRLQSFRGFALLTMLFGSAYLCLHLRGSLQKARFAAVLACFLGMGLAVLQASPAPDAAPAPVRYLGLAALAFAAWAIGALGGVTGEIAALFLLFTGRSFAAIDLAGGEALVLALFAATALVIARPLKALPPWLAAGLAGGALALYGEPSVLLVFSLALALPRMQRLRAALVAVALLALTLLRGNPRGLLRGMALHFENGGSPGLESLSLPLLSGPVFGGILALATAALVLLLARRGTLTLTRAASATAAAWLLLLLLAPRAPGGDGFLGIGLLCVAIAACAHAKHNEDLAALAPGAQPISSR
jgi:hypothetical protein